MGKLFSFHPTDKYRNYFLPSTKPSRRGLGYQQKTFTLQEKLHQKLKKITECFEYLHLHLQDDHGNKIKTSVKKNIDLLSTEIVLLKDAFDKNPYSFSTKTLKISKSHINEMRTLCDRLKQMESNQYDVKRLAKIKHMLTELEHLLMPHPALVAPPEAQLSPAVKTKPKARGAVRKTRASNKASSLSKPKQKPQAKRKMTKQASKKATGHVKRLKKPVSPSKKPKPARKVAARRKKS